MNSIRGKKSKLGYLPIGYKLMLSYMIFIVILVSVNGYVSHSMYDASMRKQTRMNIQGTILQIKDNVTYKTDDMRRISTTLYDDYNLVQSLGLNEIGGENFNRMMQVIIPKLENASKSIGLSLRLSVYFHNESVSEIYQSRAEEDSDEFNSQTYDIYHMKRIIEKDWYKRIPEEEYSVTMQWKQVEDDLKNDRISMIRRIVDTSNPLQLEEVGIMRFSVRLSELFESVDYTKLGEGSILLVKDRSGKLIYSSNTLANAMEKDASPDNEYITIKENMEQQDWKIVAHVPVMIIEQEAKKVRAFIIGMCVLCFVLFTFAGGFISRYFSKRITKFVFVLNAFRDGDLHKRISYRGKDEFSQIANALNGMGEDVEALINKVYLTQLQKKEGELEMLQLQINPHFLYNTLSSINQLAKFGETDKLQKMVLELAKFYRLTLNSGRTMIPVTLELEQADAYLDIQKVKYGQRMEVHFDIDHQVWHYETVKLILQPMIENVLKHAWSGDRIHIGIVARKEGDTILYQIIDDGLGMKQERINEIFDLHDDNHTGCGIRNIDQRIKLHYGQEYGVTIFSRVGIGTTVQIRIPAKRRKLRGLENES
ncbi:MAG: sensor histidine kinase [Candidatus Pristimantibacillus sp.]